MASDRSDRQSMTSGRSRRKFVITVRFGRQSVTSGKSGKLDSLSAVSAEFPKHSVVPSNLTNSVCLANLVDSLSLLPDLEKLALSL